jgi:hypothetical protein
LTRPKRSELAVCGRGLGAVSPTCFPFLQQLSSTRNLWPFDAFPSFPITSITSNTFHLLLSAFPRGRRMRAPPPGDRPPTTSSDSNAPVPVHRPSTIPTSVHGHPKNLTLCTLALWLYLTTRRSPLRTFLWERPYYSHGVCTPVVPAEAPAFDAQVLSQIPKGCAGGQAQPQ